MGKKQNAVKPPKGVDFIEGKRAQKNMADAMRAAMTLSKKQVVKLERDERKSHASR